MSTIETPILFIPDISGFTKFVRSTEISHSQHIISELLELLIDENRIGLQLAEIEGDALFFYKREAVPDLDTLIRQAKTMFKRFHEHLSVIDALRICTCGACSTANNLNLKFIIHAGDYGMIKVKNFTKPYGDDVVLAHRLLKNNIPSKEYMLFSDAGFREAIQTFERSENKEFTFKKLSREYEAFGETEFYFSEFPKDLIKKKNVSSRTNFEHGSDPISQEIVIKQKPFVIHQILLGIGARNLWNKNIKRLDFASNRVNRVDTPHTCVIGPNHFKFETVNSGNNNENVLSFAERLNNPPLGIVKEVTNYYEIHPIPEGSLVRLEVHFKKPRFLGAQRSGLFRKIMNKNIPQILDGLKVFAENLPEDNPFN